MGERKLFSLVHDITNIVRPTWGFHTVHDDFCDSKLTFQWLIPCLKEYCSYQTAKDVALEVDLGNRIGLQSTHYHRVDVKPYWTKHYLKDGTIGEHTFYTAVDGR